MTDILEDLRASPTACLGGDTVVRTVSEDVLDRAIDEITSLRAKIYQLRLIAGAANVDRPFSEIRKEVRHG